MTKRVNPTNWLKRGSEEKVYDNFIDAIHNQWIDLPSRQIWIHGIDTMDSYIDGEPGIEHIMANKVIKNLHILKEHSDNLPVTIHLSTCGGWVEQGLAVYDTIRLMPYPVTMISYTHARSMSSYILQAADERILLPHSYFMFHDGELYLGGTLKQVYSNVSYTKVQNDLLMDIYVESLKKKGKFKDRSRDWIQRMLRKCMDKKEDVFLTAGEAVEWGFADKILERF